jgi:phage virion morphogenesis protein
MAGAAFDFHMNGDAALRAALEELIRRAENLQPAFADIGEALLLSHRERWDDQVDPEGKHWAALSSDYAQSQRKRESRGKDKILVLDTFLRDTSLNYAAERSGLMFGTDSVYAATHQFGDADRNIPARPFIGLSDDDLENARKVITELLME